MWSSLEIKEATCGMLQGNIRTITSVSIDTRKLGPGALFVALKGEHMDGHDYVKAAFENGAAAALVSRVPDGLQNDAALIVVKDTYQALVDIAHASRKRTKGKLIGITGSVGKTGAKESTRIAIASSAQVFATQGNLNNHIGLPLSLANFAPDTSFGVFELGMNHAKELSFLTDILKPDIALITNIGPAHLEFFSGLEGIADAKAEIMEGLNKNGTMILNRDDVFYEHLLAKAQAQGIKNLLTFGEHEKADCRLVSYESDVLGAQIEASICGTSITYHIGAVGRHWAMITLAALAIATAAKIDLANAAAALANFHEPEGRGKIRILNIAQGKVTLIDDCYNANPLSMTAAITKLAELHKDAGRKIAVMGDMLELGNTSVELHKALLEPLLKHAIDKIYVTGPHMKQLYDSAPEKMRGGYAETSEKLAKMVTDALETNDTVLIKGSRGSKTDIVRDAILTKEKLADAV